MFVFVLPSLQNGSGDNLFPVTEYITAHLLPVVSTRHHLVKKMDTVEAKEPLETFLRVCYHFSVEVSLSPLQRDKVADFLITFCK